MLWQSVNCLQNFCNQVAFFRRRMWSGIVSGFIYAGLERNNLQALAARQTIALRQHDPFEPAGKRRWLAKLRQLLPRNDERFLRSVLCKISVAQHRECTGEGHVLKADHELAKGFASCLWSVIWIRRAPDNIVNVFHLKLASTNKSQNQR